MCFNEKLIIILKSIKPTWENAEEIGAINRAIKSKYSITKLNVISKYETIQKNNCA